LLEKILVSQCDLVVLQFNYGFFEFLAFSNFLQALCDQGKKVVITLHATVDPPHQENKKLNMLASALARCDRVLVHSIADLNRLKNLGLVNNVTLFPHGVLDARQMNIVIPIASKTSHDTVWIASYGFFLPHKGLLELIDAFAILVKDHPNLRLRMVNAQYPAPISAQLILQAQEKIAQLHLHERIDLHTDYLSDAQSLALLQASDLIVFPYQHTGESSSAAVRQGIAAGKPIAVTPLSIFDDVASAAHYLPGTSVSEIALGLARILQDMQEGQECFKAIEVGATKWRAEHYYPVLARRLLAMLQGLARN
jgi:glycosyltransferase involved in cell wall biosynthesis